MKPGCPEDTYASKVLAPLKMQRVYSCAIGWAASLISQGFKLLKEVPTYIHSGLYTKKDACVKVEHVTTIPPHTFGFHGYVALNLALQCKHLNPETLRVGIHKERNIYTVGFIHIYLSRFLAKNSGNHAGG